MTLQGHYTLHYFLIIQRTGVTYSTHRTTPQDTVQICSVVFQGICLVYILVKYNLV